MQAAGHKMTGETLQDGNEEFRFAVFLYIFWQQAFHILRRFACEVQFFSCERVAKGETVGVKRLPLHRDIA